MDWSSWQAILGIIFLIVGIIMIIIAAVLLLTTYKNSEKPWWVWGMLILGIILFIIGAVLLAYAAYLSPIEYSTQTTTVVEQPLM